MMALVNVAVLCALFGNTLLCFFKPRRGLTVYIILSFVSPHLQVGGTPLPYEILAFPSVFFVSFYRKKFQISTRFEHGVWLFYFIISIFATLYSVSIYGSGVRLIAIYGWVRVFMIFLLFSTILNRKKIYHSIFVAVAINLVASVAQMFVPGAIDITHALYSEEYMSVLDRYLEEGGFPRAVGTMGTPVDLGALSLIAFGISYDRLLRLEYNSILFVSILISIFLGIVALSKTSILGIPILLVLGYVVNSSLNFYKIFTFKPQNYLYAIIFTFPLASIIYYFGYTLVEYGYNLTYYFEFFGDPLRALESRYSGAGALGQTIDVAMDNLFTGVGFTAPRGEFLGDSSYVLALHRAGILGVLSVISTYLILFYRLIRKKEMAILIPLAALAITGLATARLFALEGALVITYAIVKE